MNRQASGFRPQASDLALSDPRRAPKHPGFPLHRLNSAEIKLWMMTSARPIIARSLLRRRYPGGFGVLTPHLRLICRVDPRVLQASGFGLRASGGVTELQPPFTQFQMWQIANIPRAPVCACHNYYDPEAQGPWSLRPEADRGEHHPMCQFDRHAVPVFQQAYDGAHSRLAEKLSPQKRPDEWVKLRKQVRGS